MNRDLEGRYVKRSEGVWSFVIGIVLLAVLVLVLNHTQSARLDEVSRNNCLVTTGTPDCINN